MSDQYPPPGSVPPPVYGQPVYPPAPGYPGFPPPADPGINGFAIASLVSGIAAIILPCIAPLAVIFGVVALNQIRGRGQRGRGLAIAGFVTAGAGVLVTLGIFVLALALAPTTSASHPPADVVAPTSVASTPTAQPTTDEATPTDEPSFVIGECLDNIGGYPTHASCSAKHDGEIYAMFNLANGTWPGKSTVEKKAESGCGTRLSKWADHPSTLDFYYMYPDQDDWPDDRGVICIAVDTNDKKLTGSVRHR
ncbi:DUF4190 domain-containing protein [Paractinoplanes rhizophilus]|uniref:DUF4190 domain-containing protein n=1 Tax=Paractinoplanes rhizophilus TaxID=1416877 RepID=A0ABW2I5N3_9ACTN